MAGGVGLMIFSTILIFLTEKREQVEEFRGLVVSFILLSFHILVEFIINVLIPPTLQNQDDVTLLLSLSVPSLLVGIWGVMISMFRIIMGREWTTMDLIHSLTLGFAAATIFLTIRVEPKDGRWFTFLIDPAYVWIVGPPFLLAIFRIVKSSIPLSRSARPSSNPFITGWVLIGLTFLILTIERLLGQDTIIFRILYPMGVFVLAYSIYKDPLVFFVKGLNPQYLFITKKNEGTVIFSHTFGEGNLNFLPTAVEAAMEILAETAGSATAPRTVKFLGKMITIAETDNLYAYLFSDYTNFSVERKLLEILQNVERKLGEGFDTEMESKLEKELDFFRK